MPTYDYKCSECDSVFEKFHGINDSPNVECPECSSSAKKQIGMGAGIHFKGSGFYTTDYKNSSPPKSEAAPKPCQSGGGACGCAS
ncbi:MAG: FmdB family zinc ribbon protein [Leptospirales bacterium]